MNQLGFLTDDLKYVPFFNSSFVERKVYTSLKAKKDSESDIFPQILKQIGYEKLLFFKYGHQN